MAAAQQIVRAYEDLGMTVEQIAEFQQLEPLAVKATLMQFSELFRGNIKRNEEEFSDEDHRMAMDVIRETAKYAEDEKLKFKAATYIRNDKKGRLDALRQLGNLNINVLQFNEDMKKALSSVNRSKGIVDVETSKAE